MLRCFVPRRSKPAILTLALLVAFGGVISAPLVTQAATGGIRIIAVDSDGNRIKGACYAILAGNSTKVTCDALSSNGMNGVASATMQPGSYTVWVERVVPGFRAPNTRTVTVQSGQVTTVTITHIRGANTLRMETVNTSEELVEGACFMVSPPSGRAWAACDIDDGSYNGIIRFGGLRANTSYSVFMFVPPIGYAMNTGTRSVSFTGAGATKVQVWLVRTP